MNCFINFLLIPFPYFLFHCLLLLNISYVFFYCLLASLPHINNLLTPFYLSLFFSLISLPYYSTVIQYIHMLVRSALFLQLVLLMTRTRRCKRSHSRLKDTLFSLSFELQLWRVPHSFQGGSGTWELLGMCGGAAGEDTENAVVR